MKPLNLAHLPVGKKLALAFGLVLLLTLVVMYTGLRSTERMIVSGDDISRLNQMELSVLDAQVSVERFIATGTPAEAANLQQLIAKMEGQLKDNLDNLSTPTEHNSLLEIQKALGDYRGSLDELVKAQNRRDAARSKMVNSGNEALASIDDLQKKGFSRLSEDERNENLLRRVQHISTLNQGLLNIRYLVRGYVFQQTDESNATASKALKELTVSLVSLIASSPKDELAALESAKATLESYTTGFQQFSQSVAQSKTAAKQLTSYGNSMRTAGAQLRQEQLTQRTATALTAKRTLIGITVMSIMMATLAAWVITSQIVKPLRKILQISSGIAKGDLRATLASNREDELGQLERSIHDMAQNLRQLIGHIGDGTVKIAGAAEQLSTAMGQTNKGVTRQRVETDQVATAMTEMTSTVRGVARDAEEASVAAAHADDAAKIGDLKVKQAIHEMDCLATEVASCTTSIQRLQVECRQIGGVLTVIKSLAEQTNLLALNAAIEAARAGQAGTGFAVVADEVRALAQRTQKAATEIESLVGTLIKGADTATDSMSRSSEMAMRTLALGRDAGLSLDSISQTISIVQSMNLQIAAAAEEQSVVAEQINTSIYEVRAVSELTAKASEDSASSSTALALLGSDLKSHVQRFQI